MFKVTIGNRTVAFTFEHKHFPDPVKIKGNAMIKAQTMCMLENGKGTTIYDWAYCSVKDTFNKEKARKLALAKCLKDSGFTWGERAIIWDRYFARDLSNAEYNGEPIPLEELRAELLDDPRESVGRDTNLIPQLSDN